MRSLKSMTMASVLLAGAAVIGASTAAMAGADDGGSKAFWTDSSAAPVSAPATGRNPEYRASYATPSATAAKPEKDPPSFYHATGTMSTP